MAIAKRVFLFVVVNILVMIMLMVVVRVFGLDRMLTARGLNYQLLIPFCLVWGMGGAFISLLLSKFIAKMSLGVQVIGPDDPDPDRRALVTMVHGLARDAGMSTMPEVGMYDSPEVNAFATGPSRSHALVAVSSGLMQRMRGNEVKAVLGHEIGHVVNGDMVTMTLVQGIVNAFVMFLSRVLAYVIASAMAGKRRDGEDAPMSFGMYYLVEILLQVALMIPGAMVVCWFSRWREFGADKAGAELAGRQNMIQALQALQATVESVDERHAPALQTLKISGHGTGLMRLFSTHPPLEKRIERLQNVR